jgi:hypothetical protein
LPATVGADMLAGRSAEMRKTGLMGTLKLAAIAAMILIAGCSSEAASGVCHCPQPVAYDDATIKKITKALRDLPTDNVLHRAMDDYEDERDDLRACLAASH